MENNLEKLMSDIKIFKDMPDDGAYIDWLKNNKNGFVLNIDKGGTQSIYPMLHKASGGCNSFPTERKDKNWTTNDSDYFKVCSNSRKKLSEWSWSEYDRENRCKTCFKKELDEEKTAWLTEEQNFYTNSIPHLGKNIAELENRLASETSPEKQTELKILIKVRRGQNQFRQDLLKLYPSCPLTGLDIEPLLIASHIKPWSVCNNKERLCRFNGLMLAPNIDRLFDNGLITFDTDGTIKISPTIDSENQKRLGIAPDMKLKIRPESEKYFEYHRNHVFQKEE